ncbi:HAD family hydrolase [Feifania hominis]|uniref:HAD family hydrolase n=1 Tax=Feifania hominis TaxID=2763660 RepID=A0A926DCJ2_9FIRM|nr:HAD family hydrolase [Feifania hominis]MBC8536078.1 HAD family hydrolase [Feifania hominis]
MNTILFDLDGTLLPMDQDVFTKGYFKELAAKCAPFGLEAGPLVDAVWAGTAAMVKNDGAETNETRFWQTFAGILGERVLPLKEEFEHFYGQEFHRARAFTGENPLAARTVRAVREKGYRVALATNPLFPLVGVRTRLSWLGLTPEDFSLVTSYESSHFCKPNPGYYREVLAALGAAPQDCLMVGNDTGEDGCVVELGMDFYLVTDCLGGSGKPEDYRHGSFADCAAYLESLPAL